MRWVALATFKEIHRSKIPLCSKYILIACDFATLCSIPHSERIEKNYWCIEEMTGDTCTPPPSLMLLPLWCDILNNLSTLSWLWSSFYPWSCKKQKEKGRKRKTFLFLILLRRKGTYLIVLLALLMYFSNCDGQNHKKKITKITYLKR